MNNVPDFQTLHKVILIQSTIHLLQDKKSLIRFVCRGFSELPWLSSVGLFLQGEYVSEGSPASPGRDDSQNLFDALANSSHLKKEQDAELTAFEERHGLKCIKAATSFEVYGFLLVRPSDEKRFQEFRPYLENTMNLIALRAENEEQNKIIRRHQEDLESLIAERTRALKESEQKYRTLFHSIRDALLVADLQRTIISCNQAFTDLFGYSLEEIQGCRTEILYADSSQFPRLGKRLQDKAYDPNLFITIDYKKKSGEAFPGETNIFGFVDAEGCEIGYIGLIRDISVQLKAEQERVRYEQLLRQAQKMEAIGTLAGGIAHDFNNILASVIGYTELAMCDAQKKSLLYENLNEVLTAGNRARDLIRQILAISRHEDQSKQVVPINPLIKEALKMLRSTVPTSIEFKEDIDGKTFNVQADPTQIHQVMVNLVTNAMQAMDSHEGTIEVCLDAYCFEDWIKQKALHLTPGEYVRLSVSDTGSGIAEDQIDKIFEPYYTTKEKGAGTGLGLAVVHGIVKSHGGLITVYSEEGKGSTFHVYLPLAQNQTLKQTAAESEEPLPTGTEHILLIDDELPIVKMQQQSLERLGYVVTAKTRSREALETFRSSPDKFNLVITDMTMPEMTGDKLAAAVKAINSEVAVILCTGFSEQIEAHKENIVLDGYLMKPVDKTRMATTVRKVLDSYSQGPVPGS
ncbi:MAG: PAS domain S-box protein [Desulfohalobiaceae bacterium]|nr:PAS domain S-box protein [Desulfohalobiaceae bacterium]